MDYYVLTGSNMGDSISILRQAEHELSEEVGEVILGSSYYKTAPWGFEAEQDFINQALLIKSDEDPETVLTKCLEIEKKMGRVRQSDAKGYQSRAIDIDIIFAGNTEMHSESLILPHPRMHVRAFVLIPLSEIAGDFLHPTLKKSLAELLTDCTDTSEVIAVQSWK